jgi:two-component system chemotaxis sensor kinase CheA
MQQNYQEVLTLIDKIGRIHAQFRPKREYENKMLIDSLSRFIEQSSQELGKQVVMIRDHFDINAIPHNYKLVVKEILIQLIRNSISHGIELPEDRQIHEKDPVGKIEICTKINGNNFELVYRDDGQGLQTDLLRKRAYKLGKWDNKTIESWTEDQINETIFVSGISTAKNKSMISGRGVGMDIVKEKIEQMHGTIMVEHQQGQYCSFSITLPLEN